VTTYRTGFNDNGPRIVHDKILLIVLTISSQV